MQSREISCKLLRNNDPDSVSLKTHPGRSWGRLTLPLRYLQLFGIEVESFSLSWYGGIRVKGPQVDVDFEDDVSIPDSMDNTEAGYILIPWGQPQILNTCGTHVNMFVNGNRLVIEFNTKGKYDRSELYIYQVQFLLNEPGIVEYHYYHCVSGYSTVVGAVGVLGDVVSQNVKERQPYMKKAIRIDTNPVDDDPTDEPADEPVDDPTDEPADEPVDDPTDEPADELEPFPRPVDKNLQLITVTGYELSVTLDGEAI